MTSLNDIFYNDDFDINHIKKIYNYFISHPEDINKVFKTINIITLNVKINVKNILK